jgi:hypothetical protein
LYDWNKNMWRRLIPSQAFQDSVLGISEQSGLLQSVSNVSTVFTSRQQSHKSWDIGACGPVAMAINSNSTPPTHLTAGRFLCIKRWLASSSKPHWQITRVAPASYRNNMWIVIELSFKKRNWAEQIHQMTWRLQTSDMHIIIKLITLNYFKSITTLQPNHGKGMKTKQSNNINYTTR